MRGRPHAVVFRVSYTGAFRACLDMTGSGRGRTACAEEEDQEEGADVEGRVVGSGVRGAATLRLGHVVVGHAMLALGELGQEVFGREGGEELCFAVSHAEGRVRGQVHGDKAVPRGIERVDESILPGVDVDDVGGMERSAAHGEGCYDVRRWEGSD